MYILHVRKLGCLAHFLHGYVGHGLGLHNSGAAKQRNATTTALTSRIGHQGIFHHPCQGNHDSHRACSPPSLPRPIPSSAVPTQREAATDNRAPPQHTHTFLLQGDGINGNGRGAETQCFSPSPQHPTLPAGLSWPDAQSGQRGIAQAETGIKNPTASSQPSRRTPRQPPRPRRRRRPPRAHLFHQ